MGRIVGTHLLLRVVSGGKKIECREGKEESEIENTRESSFFNCLSFFTSQNLAYRASENNSEEER